MRFLDRSLVLGLIVLGGALGIVSQVAAQSTLSGPTVALDRYELTPGENVRVTIAGFKSRVVNITICGNEGRRGSMDCDMRATRARETDGAGTPTWRGLAVTAPPAPCPCIVRVSGTDNSEIAVAPVTIVGHPVAEVVGGPGFKESFTVDIVANAAPGSLSDQLRSSLGGATLYDVTIQVKNIATFRIDNVAVASTFTRMNYDDTQAIEVADLGPLEPGSTSEQTVQVRVPALTFGEVDWSATASGQGPSVTVTDSTSSTPVLLILLAIILIVDVLILLWRFVRRRQRGVDDPDDPDGGEAVAIASPEDKRVPELVR